MHKKRKLKETVLVVCIKNYSGIGFSYKVGEIAVLIGEMHPDYFQEIRLHKDKVLVFDRYTSELEFK